MDQTKRMNDIVNLQFLQNYPIWDILLDYQDIREFYVCGGCIRDYIINGSGGKDIDIFVNCSKEELRMLVDYLEIYGHVVFGQYGSPRFYFNTNEEHYIDIVPFYNFVVSPNPIQTIDNLLENFDFTANAIGLNIKTGVIHDPVQGIADIKNHVLRAVRLDFPEKPVSEDICLSAVSVFWFRILHYQNKLGFDFEKQTKEWIIDNAYRIRDLEMFKKYFFTPNIGEEINQCINQCLHQ